jgi:hypothetical protein
MAEDKSIRQVVLERALLDPAVLDRALDLEAMTRGGRAADRS